MFTIRVPASTSNLGAGFDTLGLAVRLYLDVVIEEAESGADAGSLVVEGEGAADLSAGPENLVNRAYGIAAAFEGVAAPSVRFRARNEIPVARGLGSSAAAVVAGISSFEAATGRRLTVARFLSCCLEVEGHLDNVAASLLGGLVTVCTVPGGLPVAVRRHWPEELRLVVVVPSVPLATAEARRVLPPVVGREDAIFNIQRVALFHAAIAERRWDLLGEAMRDRLHQPYRESLLPGLAEAFRLEPDGALLGVALSGAGSSVVALSAASHEEVGRRVAACFTAAGIDTSVRVLDVDESGRRILERATRDGHGE